MYYRKGKHEKAEDRDMAYGIKETVKATGHSRMIAKMEHTARGWISTTKKFKTERAAKGWITRRQKELEGSGREGDWNYEVVEVSW